MEDIRHLLARSADASIGKMEGQEETTEVPWNILLDVTVHVYESVLVV